MLKTIDHKERISLLAFEASEPKQHYVTGSEAFMSGPKKFLDFWNYISALKIYILDKVQ